MATTQSHNAQPHGQQQQPTQAQVQQPPVASTTIELTTGEKLVAKLLSAYEAELDKVHQSGGESSVKKEENAAVVHPDETTQRRLKPMFVEWMHLKDTLAKPVPPDQTSQLEARCDALKAHLEQVGRTAGISAHCSGFVAWLLTKVNATKLEVAKFKPIAQAK